MIIMSNLCLVSEPLWILCGNFSRLTFLRGNRIFENLLTLILNSVGRYLLYDTNYNQARGSELTN